MIRKLLLSRELMFKKYDTLKKNNFIYPYIIEIEKSNQIFLFLGVHHIYSPKDKQVNSMMGMWNKFLAFEGKDKIVLIEGGMRKLSESQNESIIRDTEAGLMVYLADKANVPIISPEPDPKEEFIHLSKQFSRDQIEYYYFARVVDQWNKLVNKPDFEKYITSFLEEDKKISCWSDFDFSVKHMIQIHDQNQDHKFDLDSCRECIRISSKPTDNSVPSESGLFRDEYIVGEIKKYWEEEKSIFAVFGSGHAIVQEPALKKLLK